MEARIVKDFGIKAILTHAVVIESCQVEDTDELKRQIQVGVSGPYMS